MEPLKHECGIVLIRLRKPLAYYAEKYGTWMYGLEKLYLMMEKQHNRGQEAAGIGVVKLHAECGSEYIYRERAEGTGAITTIFDTVHESLRHWPADRREDPAVAERELPFAGELYMGHLRYSTTGRSGLSYVHPFLRRNNWRARTLLLCGNFNLTNVDRIFSHLVGKGQHPRSYADTFLLLEQIGHQLDMEVERLYRECKEAGFDDSALTEEIDRRIDPAAFLKKCAPMWDGGFALCGMSGSGETFCLRDPWGIRPAFYYADDEVIVVASERPVIQTVFDVDREAVREIPRGTALLISRTGALRLEPVLEPRPDAACSFERIYFSRGGDADIYRERKQLGRNLVPRVLEAIGHDVRNTVFSFIPNTAETAYYGMMQGLDEYLNRLKQETILARRDTLSDSDLREILSWRIRSEKVAVKDIKLRTFISEGKTRNDLAAHVYDITYGSVRETDNLVVIDDSIVRGTTLRESIIRILDRLHPRKIVIVSSSPQVRYPDCYGIDMSSLEQFIAFKAAVALLQERGLEHILEEACAAARADLEAGTPAPENHVKRIYAPFTDEEIAAKITELLRPAGTGAEVEIVYQSLDGLHRAIPNHPGDWYFSGNYPTPGGMRWVNRAFVRYMENSGRK